MRQQRNHRSGRSKQRGNTMVEFALSFSILVPVFLGVYEFGYAFYVYNEMQTAVRSGARYASRRVYDSATTTPSEAYINAVRNTVVYGDPSGGTVPIAPGLNTEDVAITVTFDTGVPRNVTVGIVDFDTDAVVNVLEFSTKPSITIPYVGRFDPI